ncbi:MAG: L-rhamnose mutarotase [Terriglobales bacterium]
MRRYGQCLRLRPERRDEYLRHHAAVWPEVRQALAGAHIRNYSIFLWGDLLFGYFEYMGGDFAADMAQLAEDPKTQQWWALMRPMQLPMEGRGEKEWWADMQEVFHLE